MTAQNVTLIGKRVAMFSSFGVVVSHQNKRCEIKMDDREVTRLVFAEVVAAAPNVYRRSDFR